MKATETKEGSLVLFTLAAASHIFTLIFLTQFVYVIVKYKTDPTLDAGFMIRAQKTIIFFAGWLGVWTLGIFLPSWFIYLRHGRRRDRLSLTVSGLSLVLLFLQFLAALFEWGR